MKSIIGQKGTHLEGLPLRVVSWLVGVPGPRQLIYGSLVNSIGYPDIEALELPADIGLYTHEHLITTPAALLPPATKEG